MVPAPEPRGDSINGSEIERGGRRGNGGEVVKEIDVRESEFLHTVTNTPSLPVPGLPTALVASGSEDGTVRLQRLSLGPLLTPSYSLHQRR